MRRLIAATAVALVVIGAIAAPVSAAPVNPKVVIIVGAVHGQTGSYLQRGEEAYAEARKYTSNVVKVFSPCATWSKVKAAMQGASIVIYMGHGNGYPSPYRTSPWPYSQNGFGLNATCNAGHYNTTYYGEHYIAGEVDLAPNAVVLLHHLCYASGNSEPGYAEPTTSVAKQRADNYAAGFLKANARGVIADGHSDPDYYLWALFSTHQTLEEMWRAAPNFHNHVIAYASTRSSGYTARLDPDSSAPSGFYRSLVTKPSISTDDVTGAPWASTDVDPAWFVAPGAASVSVDGAALHDSPGLDGSSTPLTLDTALRVDSVAGTTTEGSQVIAVHALDGAPSGFMAAGDLTPRDSTGPTVWQVDKGTGAFSPNGDGRSDTLTLTALVSEDADWRVTWTDDGGDVLDTNSGFGSEIAATWTGKVGSTPVPDGTYHWEIRAADEWGNPEAQRGGDVVVDTVAPVLTASGADLAGDDTPMITPNGDSYSESVALAFDASEEGSILLRVRNPGGSIVASDSSLHDAGTGSVAWNGKMTSGATAANGQYAMSLTPTDSAGNVGGSITSEVIVYSSLKNLWASPSTFYPQDRDAIAKSTVLKFQLLHPATVTWQVISPSGAVVRTIYTDLALSAGTRTWTWDGRTDSGALVPQGRYMSRVTATDGTYTATVQPSVYAIGFRISPSDTTPARGQKVTVTVISGEALSKNPYLAVYQPGVAGFGATMLKVSSTTYKVTITLKSGSAGTMKFKVVGYDTKGGRNETYLSLPIS
ncbi:MAG TPA: FlgD immunoglobulin-like domain containing protein [Candidatus Limnocylindrales bacterium]|nr:FlgD immunoglobulin-like domain containing protein [Candidatus Limnocylindrales bacterium]